MNSDSLLAYCQKFYIEYQSLVGADKTTCALGAVGKCRGYEKAPARTHIHELQSLHPAGDNLGYAESGGLSNTVPSMSLPV